MEIDVFRETGAAEEEDVALSEFSDEIDEWIIDEFKKIGLDTAKSVPVALNRGATKTHRPRGRNQQRSVGYLEARV